MARSHRREKGVEIAPCRPGWIGRGVSRSPKLTDEDLGGLYRFFVLEAPSEGLSSLAVTFEMRGWGKRPWTTEGTRLRGRLLTDLGFKTGGSLFIGTSAGETKALFRASGLGRDFAREYKGERIAMYHNEGAQFVSIMCHIRHALAHGRYAVSDSADGLAFFFESGKRSRDGFRVRSRMVLKYSTLKTWISIITREADK